MTIGQPSIGTECDIHPTAVIGDAVTIGNGVAVGPFAVLTGPLEIGDNCWIGPSVTLGQPPEWIGKTHPKNWRDASPHQPIVIGADSTIREHSTVHHGGERPTVIGAGAFIMNRVSIGHDVQLGPGCTIAPSVTFGGHVSVGDGVNLGIGTVVHQRRVIGTKAMVGMGSVVSKDIPPFAKSFGNPVGLQGVNTVGMERAGYNADEIAAIVQLYGSGSMDDGARSELPDALQSTFEWWRTRATKPLI
ncbi:MAG: acyl-ACP--UDP-N- acetylglucosamine O-acyltransferase [Rhodococcus sp.]|nr:acyl-ACP--UDP-N- acetylglucosamine O-acyltransferase [Rhodococcus sp. (in: high G+C Gram-positive bacteria)]